MSVKIYHNPRCTKSRLTLAILEEKGLDFEVIKYLEDTPSVAELKALLDELGMDPRNLMRTFEAPYKENNLDDESLSEDDLIQAMVDNPILIERPIVKTDKGIAIGRPPENILAIL
ncbi:MAG TPA: arsenate reductase (glutaredoxin) [Gammaproteobacteria bacterium]|jgi:arsenate reductase|nr:arsenate reductase (glutaredoxin) [Gammaproteobacteria bacterium]HAE70052.1 arsenate reductase (glutaredoxin) [Gammaproteobacteria bacterium]HAN33398.1 arsenate reductase (glutaredoxin) [Gammaproteobacteria bacterium]HAO38363.1 arsenate reductase (glutaredoxin) [Gammaproteobacteria bacterium]HAO44596.1 arsenate reductase (glutaredoxin) [Gammaproteobacteria bacterium]